MLLNLHVVVMKMKIIDKLEQVEHILLPPGKKFSDEQMQVIGADGNIDVVAGPGSGKTTVLAAKLIMLLAKQRRGDKGICCITHTNVAVDEVKNRIKQSGLGTVEYPNFVGTIQSFFDHFFGGKAFGLLFPEKNLRILDGDQYDEIYDKEFLRWAPSWWNRDWIPNYKGSKAYLVISENKDVYFENTAKNRKSNRIINQALSGLINRGIINSEQMMKLAQWYVSLHVDQLSSAMDERFDYLLLDEAQDTNHSQYQLLTTLTKGTQIRFQRFGDPYQGLYTIYGSENEDAWNPSSEGQNNIAQVKEIATTARFGSGIAELVKNVCYELYPTFHSSFSQTAFANRFIIFESGDDLEEKYQRLLSQCESENDSFLKCSKKDKIVAPQHDDLKRWFHGYEKSAASPIAQLQPATDLFHAVLRELAFANRQTVSEEHKILQENIGLAESVAKIVRCLFSEDSMPETLDKLVSPLLKDDARIASKEVIQDLINESMHIGESDAKNSNSIKSRIELSTIHGIKGETHRSTLLLLDSKVYWGKPGESYENIFFEKLFPFLIGKRKEYETESDAKTIKACLKYAYVALSRPKFLAGIAIPKKDITSEQINQLINCGWKEAK